MTTTKTTTTIGEARKGDVVSFKETGATLVDYAEGQWGYRRYLQSCSLSVESEPQTKGTRIYFEGREDRGGGAYVRRWYFRNLPVVIERLD